MTKTSVETKHTWTVSFYSKEEWKTERMQKEEQIERMLFSAQESDHNAMMSMGIRTGWAMQTLNDENCVRSRVTYLANVSLVWCVHDSISGANET